MLKALAFAFLTLGAVTLSADPTPKRINWGCGGDKQPACCYRCIGYICQEVPCP